MRRRRQCTLLRVSNEEKWVGQRCENILIEHQIPRGFRSLVVSKALRDIWQGDTLQVLVNKLPIRPPLRRFRSQQSPFDAENGVAKQVSEE